MGQSARIQLCKALRDLSKKTQSCNCCQIANHQNKVTNTFVDVLNFCSQLILNQLQKFDKARLIMVLRFIGCNNQNVTFKNFIYNLIQLTKSASN